MFDLAAIQNALGESGLDGWLVYDFRASNKPGRRVLDIPDQRKTSRRFLYAIPREGEPLKIVHAIEPAVLDHLPGRKRVYSRWQDLEAAIAEGLKGMRRVAMEYAPGISNPYVSQVDGGTLEAVRKTGVEVASSGDLVQRFEATWDESQWQMHLEADRHTRAAFEMVWALVAERVRAGRTVTECEVQAAIVRHFEANGLETYSPPIVGVGAHSGDPHFENTPANDTPIREGDFLLVDLWAKMRKERAVYSDLTRVGFVGETVPEKYEQIFSIVARGRDAAVACVRSAFADRRPLRGFEVDDACRNVIEEAGYGRFFIHRTGHNIGQEVHGNGAHMDNLETHEERLVMPRTCFSVEPGIYQAEFGVRSEVDVYIDGAGGVHVTGGPAQERVVAVLGRR